MQRDTLERRGRRLDLHGSGAAMRAFPTAVLISMGVMGVGCWIDPPKSASVATPVAQAASSHDEYDAASSFSPHALAVKAAGLDFHRTEGGFGAVLLADFTVRNPTQHAIKDIEITCFALGASGTVVDRNVLTIYDVVKPNAKKTFRGFNMGLVHDQADKESCQNTDLKVLG